MSFSGNSGGGSSIATSQDVALNNPADGQMLGYNGTLEKWQNKIPPSAVVSSVAGKIGNVTLDASDVTNALSTSQLGTANGIATLDSGSHLPTAQIPDLSSTYVLSRRPNYAATNVHNFEPRGSLYNFKASNTRRWRAGLARAGRPDYTGSGQFLNELWIGDSIMGGCTGLNQATGSDTTRFDRLHAGPRFYEQAVSQLTGVPIAGTGLVRIVDGGHIDSRISFSGVTPPSYSQCIGLTPGSSCTFTSNLAGNTVLIYYYDNFSSSTTGLTVSINGASSGSNYLAVTGSNTSKWKYATLTGVTGLVANSTVTITSSSGTNTVQVGLIEVRNASGGISVHNLGYSGSKSTNWLTSASVTSAYRQVTDTGAFPYTFDVIHLGWGLFDASSPPANTPSTVHDTLVSIRGYFPTSDVVLHAMPTPLSLTDATWLPYVTAYYQAADDLDIPLVDMHDLFGGGVGMQALGLTADTTAHYLPPAYEMWGRATSRAAL